MPCFFVAASFFLLSYIFCCPYICIFFSRAARALLLVLVLVLVLVVLLVVLVLVLALLLLLLLLLVLVGGSFWWEREERRALPRGFRARVEDNLEKNTSATEGSSMVGSEKG